MDSSLAAVEAAKSIDRATEQALHCLSLSPSSPLISFSFSLALLTRHRCVAQKKQKQRKRDREKGFALSAKKDAWLFSMPATSSDAVV